MGQTVEGARRDDSPVATKEQQVPGAMFVRAAELVRRPVLAEREKPKAHCNQGAMGTPRDDRTPQ